MCALAEIVSKLHVREKVDATQGVRAAQHADQKKFKAFLDPQIKVAYPTPPPKPRPKTKGRGLTLEDFRKR